MWSAFLGGNKTSQRGVCTSVSLVTQTRQSGHRGLSNSLSVHLELSNLAPIVASQHVRKERPFFPFLLSSPAYPGHHKTELGQ